MYIRLFIHQFVLGLRVLKHFWRPFSMIKVAGHKHHPMRASSFCQGCPSFRWLFLSASLLYYANFSSLFSSVNFDITKSPPRKWSCFLHCWGNVCESKDMSQRRLACTLGSLLLRILYTNLAWYIASNHMCYWVKKTVKSWQ